MFERRELRRETLTAANKNSDHLQDGNPSLCLPVAKLVRAATRSLILTPGVGGNSVCPLPERLAGIACRRKAVFSFCNRTFVGTVASVGITLQQFQQMTARVNGRKSRADSRVSVPSPTRSANTHTIILGVDPSLRGTGYGVIELAKPHPRTLAHGTITCPAAWPHSRCLANIYKTIRAVLRKHSPTVCAVEGLFFAQNLQTAMLMGEARGAALAAIAEAGLEIYEIAPRKVKQAIVGYGAAQKLAVAKMVQRLLQLTELPPADAADALAVALAHAQGQGRYGLTSAKRI